MSIASVSPMLAASGTGSNPPSMRAVVTDQPVAWLVMAACVPVGTAPGESETYTTLVPDADAAAAGAPRQGAPAGTRTGGDAITARGLSGGRGPMSCEHPAIPRMVLATSATQVAVLRLIESLRT